MQNDQASRRGFIRRACAMAAGGCALAATSAKATQNATMRGLQKYQDSAGPDQKTCGNCYYWQVSPRAGDPPRCLLFPGDTELSAGGYCNGWSKKS